MGSTTTGDDHANDVQTLIESNDLVMFVSRTCPYCAQAEMLLTDYEPRVVEATADMRGKLAEMTGKTSVPSVWVKGQYVGGCNDGPEDWMGVVPMLNSGKMEELLGHGPSVGTPSN